MKDFRTEQNGNITFIGLNYNEDIWYPNFSGTVDLRNKACGVNPAGNPVGKRSFKIVIRDQEIAQYLMDNKWNVKSKELTDGSFVWTIQVFLEYKQKRYSPTVWTVIDGEDPENKCYKTEETIDDLDHLEISSVDVSIRPYDWEYIGATGRKAELHSMQVHLVPCPF